MPEYTLLEASIYSMYGLLGSGNCNNGLLQKISFKYSNASWHLSDQMNGVFFFSRLVIGRVYQQMLERMTCSILTILGSDILIYISGGARFLIASSFSSKGSNPFAEILWPK